MRLLTALLSGLLLSSATLLPALSWLLARLARLLSAALLPAMARLITLMLLARFVVRIHSYSIVLMPDGTTNAWELGSIFALGDSLQSIAAGT